jgi:hypothetical protein
MKRGFLLGLLTLVMIFAFTLPASAQSWEAKVNSAYFHYSREDGGKEQPVDIDFTGLEPNKDFSVSVQRLDSNGRVIETIHSAIISSNVDGIANFTYVFGDNFNDFKQRGFPYQVKFEGITVMKGYVAEPPSDDFRSSGVYRGYFEAVGMGTVVYNEFGEGLLHDEKNHAQVLTEENGYMLLHYRLPIASIDNEHIIRIFNENNQEIELTISSNDIYAFQGNTDAEARRSFILVNTSGEELPFVDERAYSLSWVNGDNPFKAKVDKGVYTYELEDTVDVETYKGESVWLVGNKDNQEFDLYADRTDIREGHVIRWNVIRETKEIADVYNSHTFFDVPSQENFGDEIEDGYERNTLIRYRVDDSIGVGEYGCVSWFIEKTLVAGTVVDWQNGISGSEYAFYFEEDYEIRSPAEIADALTDFLDNIGLGDEAGKVMFTMLSIIAVSAGLAFAGVGTTVILIANFGLVGLFALIGFIPLWLIIGLIMLAVAGLFIAMRGNV